MKVNRCYRCGRKFRDGEGYHWFYNEHINKLVPVCCDDTFCGWQRPGRAAMEVVAEERREKRRRQDEAGALV